LQAFDPSIVNVNRSLADYSSKAIP